LSSERFDNDQYFRLPESARVYPGLVNTLLDVIEVAPGGATALILPESGARVSYDSLREQVMTMAGALAGAGIALLGAGVGVRRLSRPRDFQA